MFRNAFVGLTLLAACSPIVDNKNMPDAAIDSPATTPPKISMANPADKSKGVSILTKVDVWFDYALDPTTVTATTVRLRAGLLGNIPTPGTDTVHGTVAYDDAQHKLTFSPYRPLTNGYEYALILNGVKDTAGNMLPVGSATTFRTYLNGDIQRAVFNQPQYTVAFWYDDQVDPDGHWQKYGLYHYSSGTDGVWMTADDPIGCGYNGYAYGPEGRLLDIRAYAAGPDGLCNTGDDVVSSSSRYAYDAAGLLTEVTYFNGAGPDGIWGTSDDVIGNYNKFIYTMTGQLQQQTTYNDKGVDNIWKTADDRWIGGGNYEYRYDTAGNNTHRIYRSNGADNIPFTPDDLVQYWYEYSFDQNSFNTRYTYHGSSGPDGVWLTADDPVGFYYAYANEAAGDRQKYYSATGPDGMWFTSDDVCSGMSLTKLDANKLMTSYETFSAGTDGKPCTADDILSSVSIEYRYDKNGNKIGSGQTCQPGADGVLDTADDRCAYTWLYDLAH